MLKRTAGSDFGGRRLVAVFPAGRPVGQRGRVQRPTFCESIKPLCGLCASVMHVQRPTFCGSIKPPTGCGPRSTTHNLGNHFCTTFCTFLGTDRCKSSTYEKNCTINPKLITDYRLLITPPPNHHPSSTIHHPTYDHHTHTRHPVQPVRLSLSSFGGEGRGSEAAFR